MRFAVGECVCNRGPIEVDQNKRTRQNKNIEYMP